MQAYARRSQQSFIELPLDSAPIGAICQWTTPDAPYGWSIADGKELSRTGNAALFAVIGTTHGIGDGSTTFNIPHIDFTGFYVIIKIFEVTKQYCLTLDSTLTSVVINKISPSSDGVTSFQIMKSDGVTPIVTIDTLNGKIYDKDGIEMVNKNYVDAKAVASALIFG